MKSVTEVILDTIEETKQTFFDIHGKNCEDEKRLFINWYFEIHSGQSTNILLYELSEHYLHISEDRILKYLNGKK